MNLEEAAENRGKLRLEFELSVMNIKLTTLKLAKLTEDILFLAEMGDYSNGNEAQGSDEGRVRAGEMLLDYRKQLEDLKPEMVVMNRLLNRPSASDMTRYLHNVDTVHMSGRVVRGPDDKEAT